MGNIDTHDLQKRFHTACKYISAKDVELKREALTAYVSGEADVKAEALQKFPSAAEQCAAVHWPCVREFNVEALPL